MSRSRRVLFLEDDLDYARLVRDMIARYGRLHLDVEHVTTLEVALERLGRGGIDIALIDLHLPDAHGAEAVVAIRRKHPEVAVVALSAHDDPGKTSEFFVAGAQEYLSKNEIGRGEFLPRILRHAHERHRMLQDLHASERRFRELIEQAGDAVVVIDAAGLVGFVNSAGEAIFGRSKETLMGRPFGLPSAVGRTIEVEIVRRGARVLAEMRGQEIVWDGRPAVLVTLRDATERRATEEALRESEARLRLLLDQLPAIVWSVDAELRVTSILGTGLRSLEIDVSESVGKGLVEILGPEAESSPVVGAVRRALAGETVPYALEANGRWYDSSVQPLRDASGEIVGAIAISLDVTESRRTEAALRESQAQLLQAQKMEAVGRLAGGVAHDFNNLLTVIQGYTDLLLAEFPEGDPARPDLEEIECASGRAAELTRQLLAFGRKQVLHPRTVDVNQIVEGLSRMLRRLIGEDVELVTIPALAPTPVHADPSQIEQVLVNLAVNARDAMPRGGKLTIEVCASESVVAIRVADTGCGMNEEVRARIFEPFFTTKEPGKGTGLGLATVYGIVHQSGGGIAVRSAPGAGTTFTIELPRDQRAPVASTLETLAGEAIGGSESILLVEDEDGVRRLAMRALRRAGYEVLEARGPGEALLLCEGREESIDLVVADVVMPQMSGPDLVERLRAMHPELRALFISGYDRGEFGVGGAAGVDLLEKPFGPDDLVRRARAALDSP